VPGCSAAARENYRATAAGRRCGVHALGRYLCSLEERTNIANQAKADLFISIHANSSRDHAARGIETYYLNLKGSAEAMEVAARENASSQEGVHDLQNLVMKIAKTKRLMSPRNLPKTSRIHWPSGFKRPASR